MITEDEIQTYYDCIVKDRGLLKEYGDNQFGTAYDEYVKDSSFDNLVKLGIACIAGAINKSMIILVAEMRDNGLVGYSIKNRDDNLWYTYYITDPAHAKEAVYGVEGSDKIMSLPNLFVKKESLLNELRDLFYNRIYGGIVLNGRVFIPKEYAAVWSVIYVEMTEKNSPDALVRI